MRRILTLGTLLWVGCSSSASLEASRSEPSVAINAQVQSVATPQTGRTIAIPWTAAGSLVSGPYSARVRQRTASLGGTKPTELTYATLERGGHVVKRFDGAIHIVGNETRISFAENLGPEPVLAVEQETHRDWRFWIVSTAPRVSTLIDSLDWHVGRTLKAEDIDGDGRAELRQWSLHYWFFDRFTNVDSPFPQVIFRFDTTRGRYVPANAAFPDETGRRIEELKQNVAVIERNPGDPTKGGMLLGAVTGVVLELCYAARIDEAWQYYDEHYSQPDRAERRQVVLRHMADDPVYRSVRGKAG
jgi:hypothetical protein